MLDVPEDDRHRGEDWRAHQDPEQVRVQGPPQRGRRQASEPEPDVPPLLITSDARHHGPLWLRKSSPTGDEPSAAAQMRSAR